MVGCSLQRETSRTSVKWTSMKMTTREKCDLGTHVSHWNWNNGIYWWFPCWQFQQNECRGTQEFSVRSDSPKFIKTHLPSQSPDFSSAELHSKLTLWTPSRVWVFTYSCHIFIHCKLIFHFHIWQQYNYGSKKRELRSVLCALYQSYNAINCEKERINVEFLWLFV